MEPRTNLAELGAVVTVMVRTCVGLFALSGLKCRD